MILVSACLANMKTRYDGTARPLERIVELVRAGKALPVCPELLGGLGVPREPSTISSGSGWDVLEDRARVCTESGRDVSHMFRTGAQRVCALAGTLGVSRVIFKSGSPSCGSGTRDEDGVTTALLKSIGIAVETEQEHSGE